MAQDELIGRCHHSPVSFRYCNNHKILSLKVKCTDLYCLLPHWTNNVETAQQESKLLKRVAIMDFLCNATVRCWLEEQTAEEAENGKPIKDTEINNIYGEGDTDKKWCNWKIIMIISNVFRCNPL